MLVEKKLQVRMRNAANLSPTDQIRIVIAIYLDLLQLPFSLPPSPSPSRPNLISSPLAAISVVANQIYGCQKRKRRIEREFWAAPNTKAMCAVGANKSPRAKPQRELNKRPFSAKFYPKMLVASRCNSTLRAHQTSNS